MFDTDLDVLDTADLLAAAAEYAQVENRAATRILEAALAYADRNAVPEGYEPLPGYERVVVYGGDGCPGVAEFAPIELGAVLGISRVSARRYLEFYAAQGRTEVTLRYGTTGRPERRYTWRT